MRISLADFKKKGEKFVFSMGGSLKHRRLHLTPGRTSDGYNMWESPASGGKLNRSGYRNSHRLREETRG